MKHNDCSNLKCVQYNVIYAFTLHSNAFKLFDHETGPVSPMCNAWQRRRRTASRERASVDSAKKPGLVPPIHRPSSVFPPDRRSSSDLNIHKCGENAGRWSRRQQATTTPSSHMRWCIFNYICCVYDALALEEVVS